MAVNSLVCAGSQWNGVARSLAASTASVVTSDSDPLFPPASFGDGLASAAGRMLTTSSGFIRVDKNVVVNGTMETAATSSSSVLATWVVDAGAVSKTSAQHSRGSFAMQLGAGAATAHEDILANAGERFSVSAALLGDGANAARLQVQNLATFNYLTSSGTWQAAATFCAQNLTAAWTTTFVTTTIEAFSAANLVRDTMPLRIQLSCAAGTVFADDVVYSPATTLVVAIGFLNMDPGIVAKVVSSSDNFTTQTTEATMADAVPSFWYYSSTPIDRQYVSVIFNGVNSTQSGPIYGGELALAQPVVVTRPFAPSLPIQFDDAQDRQVTILGQQQVYRYGQHPIRSIALPYQATTLAEYQQLRDIERRAQFGATASLIIPTTSDSEVCLFGRLESTWVATQEPVTWEGAVLKIVEMPFPVWVS